MVVVDAMDRDGRYCQVRQRRLKSYRNKDKDDNQEKGCCGMGGFSLSDAGLGTFGRVRFNHSTKGRCFRVVDRFERGKG